MRIKLSKLKAKLSAHYSSPEKVFTDIYKKGRWSGGLDENDFSSGAGSRSDSIVELYIADLKQYIVQNCDSTDVLVDLGCGDFHVGSKIAGIFQNYVGVDVVSEVVKRNQEKYSTDRINFLHRDFLKDPLPNGNICIIRQVFQHLSNRQITRCLQLLQEFEHVIITEHLPLQPDLIKKNIDKVQGSDVRLSRGSGVYLDAAPFNIPAEQLIQVSCFAISHPKTGQDWGLLSTVDYVPKKK